MAPELDAAIAEVVRMARAHWPLAALLALCAYPVALAVYRLNFHPLAKFPGPRLAAVTTLYEGYHDAVRKGQFIFKVGELHKRYGPIVRIGPNELHILDPSYYTSLYNMSNRYSKSPYFYSMFGNPLSVFGTPSADVHRMRRGNIAPYFSSAAVAKFFPSIQAVTNRLVERMEVACRENEPVPLSFAFRAMTVDIITEYSFGHKFGVLNRLDWGESFNSSWYSLWEMSPTIRQLPLLMPMFMGMPRWLTKIVNPPALEIVDMFRDIEEQTKITLHSTPDEIRKLGHPNIIWELSRNASLPASEKTFERLAAEANGLVVAGFETTGANLVHATFQIMHHPEVFRKLVETLEDAIPDPDQMPNYTALEKIPYLFAVVKESLRHSVGAYSRLPRVVGPSPLQYKDWVIPAGATVGMSTLFVAYNSDVFEDPLEFKPERWLSADEPPVLDPHNLERNLHTFGKGSRGCAGIHLAHAEFYSVLATVFRRFGRRMELWNTTADDMAIVHDYFAGMVKKGRSLKVLVRKEE